MSRLTQTNHTSARQIYSIFRLSILSSSEDYNVYVLGKHIINGVQVMLGKENTLNNALKARRKLGQGVKWRRGIGNKGELYCAMN